MNRRTLLTAIATVVASAAIATPAQATVGIQSFSLTPSTAQAGGSSSQPGPDLTLDVQFADHGDTPKDATLALARGLLANPSVVPACAGADFQAGHCPDASRIGHGYTTGTAFGVTASLPTDAYLVQPQGIEPARIGLIVTFFGYPVATQSAPVAIRTTPDVGIDLPLMGLPNEVEHVPVVIDALHLTIFGSVGGQAFTRNPTSCGPATSSLTVDSYADPTPQTATSSFTPTGCASLPYAPTISGSVAEDAGDDGLSLQATLTQQYGEADSQSITLAFPAGASPRLSAFANACTNPVVTSCTPVGSATLTTPLLSAPLQANVVLIAHSGTLPTVAILVPPPFGLELDATPILSGPSIQALVANVPDIPITTLALNLPGGPNSLFRAGNTLCDGKQTWSALFTAWSGATANPSSPAPVSDCRTPPPGSTVGGGAPGGSGSLPGSGASAGGSTSGSSGQRTGHHKHHRHRHHRHHKPQHIQQLLALTELF